MAINIKHISGRTNPADILASPRRPISTGDTAPPTIDIIRYDEAVLVPSPRISARAMENIVGNMTLSNRYVAIRELLDNLRKLTGGRRKICLPVWVARCFEPFFAFSARLTHTRPLYTSYALSTLEGNGHFSHMKATMELGYKPRPISSTIADTIAWLRRSKT